MASHGGRGRLATKPADDVGGSLHPRSRVSAQMIERLALKQYPTEAVQYGKASQRCPHVLEDAASAGRRALTARDRRAISRAQDSVASRGECNTFAPFTSRRYLRPSSLLPDIRIWVSRASSQFAIGNNSCLAYDRGILTTAVLRRTPPGRGVLIRAGVVHRRFPGACVSRPHWLALAGMTVIRTQITRSTPHWSQPSDLHTITARQRCIRFPSPAP
jgi:hypothetical protein